MRMVFCYQNCSDLLWEKIAIVMEKKLLKFEAEGREFVNFLRSLEQFIQTVTSHSAYAATETKSNGVKIDGLLPPNFL